MYQNREQTEAKHAILRRYLVPFAQKILRTYGSLDFIDGFSGPWENRDEDRLTDTSIGIALETLSAVVEDVRRTQPAAKVCCIFNELDGKAFTKLSEFVERHGSNFPSVDVRIFQGRFEDNASVIRSASTNRFRLLFVDPKGYTGFPPSVLSEFKGRNTEIFVNVMRSFLVRFVSGAHEDRRTALVKLLGENRANYLIDTGLTIETLENEYLRMLRADLGYRYSGLSPIHNPDRNEIHFNLAFATNHPAGMEVMRTAEFGALSEHDKRRYEKTITPDSNDLFSLVGAELETFGPYLTTRKKHRERVGNEIIQVLSENSSGIKFEELAAILQQSLFLKRTEISDELVRLASEGRVNPSWKDRGARKPGPNDLIMTGE